MCETSVRLRNRPVAQSLNPRKGEHIDRMIDRRCRLAPQLGKITILTHDLR